MKSNRNAKSAAARRNVERHAKALLMAAVARKYGEPQDDGSRVVALSGLDIMSVPAGERFSIRKSPGNGGVELVVFYDQEAETPQ